jgi:hypothetical protein
VRGATMVLENIELYRDLLVPVDRSGIH